MELEEHYFRSDAEWRTWLHENHQTSKGIYLIFYKVVHENDSMRWEEAVKVALCYGWIDSTVKSLGDGKRRQYFCPRNPKSVWSALNKKYIKQLVKDNLMQVCSFMGTHPDKINPSKTEAKRLGIKHSSSNTEIDNFIRAVQLRYNRLVRDKKKEFLEMRSNKEARIFTYAADNS